MESPYQDDPFRPPILKLDWIFWLSWYFQKKKYLVCEPKNSFYGRKWHCFGIHIPWHGIISEKRKSLVRCKMEPPNGQVRPGKAKSGHARLSGSENTCTKFSVPAVQKLPAKLYVNGLQSIEITVNTQIAPGHVVIFAIYLHSENGIWKSLEMPAILFGTLHAHGDVLPMICAKYFWFWRRQEVLRMQFSTSTLKGQRYSGVMTLSPLAY